MVSRISAERGAGGVGNETQFGGPIPLDNLHTGLHSTKEDDLTILPFEADFELNWKGRLVGGGQLESGNYTLCVTAKDADENLSPGPAEGRADSCVSFEIRRSTPMVTLGPAFGLAKYDRFQGESILPPSAIHGNLEFVVTSTTDDVRSVLLRRDGGSEPVTFDPFVWSLYSSSGQLVNVAGVRSLAEIAPPVAGVFGLFDENQSTYLPRGLYTLTAETVSGGKTTTPFRLVALAVNHNRSRATYNPVSGLFEGRVILDMSSELGLYSAQRHAPDTYETVLSRLFEDPGSATGHPAAGELSFDVKPATAPTASLDGSVVVGVTDVEGNTFAYGLSGMVSGPTRVDEVSGVLRFAHNSSTAGVLGGGMIRDPELPQVLVTSGPGVTGTYLSPVFNAFDSGSAGGGALPGSVMPIGPAGLLMTTYIGTFTPVEVGLSMGSLVRNRPMSDRVAVGKVKFTLFSNDLAGAVSASEKYVYEQEIFASTWAPPLPEPPFSLQEVNRFYQLKVELTEYLDGGILRYDCLVVSTSIPNFCESGRARRPAVSSVGTPLHGINFARFSGPRGQAALGSSSVDVGVPLGSAVKLSGVTTRPNLGPVNFFLTQGTLRAEEGYKAVPTATAFDIQPEQASSVIVGSVTVTFNYAFANLTQGQESMLRVARYRSLFRKRNDLMDQNPGSDVADAIIDTARHSVSFKTAQLGTFILMAPIYQNPCRVSRPGIAFLSDGCGPTIEEVDETAGPVATAMKIALARGLLAVAKVFQLGPTGLPFNPAGTVKMTYTDQELDRLGVNENDLALYQFTTAGSFQRLPNLTVDAEHNIVTARVGQFSSLFTIMAGTNAVLLDGIPPSTQLVFDGTSTVDGSGTILIGSRTSVGFEAIDFNEPGLEPVGVFETHYLVDQPFLSTTSTPGQTFSVPFFLPAGRHSLVYFSADRAGNYETPKTAQIEVASSTDTGGGPPPPPPPETAPGRGLAISKDSQDGLWMVLQDTSSVISLAKFNSTGVFEGGLPLPGAGDFGAWRIGFDEQGNAVAVGSSLGETTGPDVAVYRVSPEGSLLSTAAFDAGLGGADIAMDASGDLWIAGAVQAGGTETDIRAQLALWRYTPQDGLKLKSLYAGPGGLDAGFGVRLDASGNVWVVGFSSNPATPGPNKLDLALWKYEATGSSLTAGPFRVPGYARGIGETTNAKLAIHNGAIFLAAGKLNPAGDMDLATAKLDLLGAEIWSRNWHSEPVADEVPASILSSAQSLSIAGGVFRGQDRPLAVWRYSLDGTLLSAETVTGVGKANDMTSNAEGTWLAVEGRGAPYKFTGGAALPGSGDGQPPQDTLPPRTALVVGEPKSGTDPIVIATFTSLGFAAVDDLAQVGDGAGSGVRETLYLVDIDPQSCDGVVQVSTAPRGTCANPVYSSTFTLAAGTHTIAYLSRDNAGNEEAPRQTNFTVNLVFSAPTDNKPPRTTLAVGAPKFGAAPLFIATHTPLSLSAVDDLAAVGDGLGSGVSQTLYLVDATPESCEGVPQSTAAPRGTCANSVYGSTFTLGPGTHTITFLSRDFIGNEEAPQVRNLTADGTPPVTKALVNGQTAASEILTSTDSISFLATDAGSGVRETFYKLDGAAASSSTQVFTLAAGTHSLVFFSVDNLGNRETDQSANLTVVAVDTTAPALALVPPDGSTVTTARPLIRADYADAGRGIDSASVRLELDGVDVTAMAAVTVSSAAYNPATDIGQGTHAIAARVLDLAGNESNGSSRFFVDSIAPATSLLINGQPASSGPLALISTDSVSFAATDAGTGVKETRYSLDGAAELVFSAAFTLSPGTHTLSYRSQDNAGNLETAKTAAISVVGPDLTAPVTVLDIGHPKFGTELVYIATATKLGLTASEPGRIYFAVDAGTFTVYAGSFSISGEGVRTVTWYGEDLNGNRETTKTATVFLDATSPVTEFFVNGTSVAGGSLNLALGDVLGLSSTDTASGVREVRYSLDGGGFLVYGGTFTLGAGAHTLRFRGQDNVLNEEQERSVGILVASPPGGDQTPPSLSLLCPGAEGGICSVFRETVFVRGKIFDEQLRQFRLEAGTVLISSGTGNRDGVLGVWDVSGLAGVRELTLTGEDLAGNTATLTRRVFIGEPARLLIFGGKKEMGQPQGVAVDNSRGVVYVANTNKGEIGLYTLGGEFIKKYPDFRHPRAVAVDEGGNLYIAESGKDRIVKLGPLGNPLWTVGSSGRRPLEFRDPSGIAARGGKVAVSDTRNRRVQILDADGNFQQEFPIPEGSETLVPDDGDSGDEPENRKGVPVGIALDGQGRIYVADAKNKKGLAYDPQGVLLREFGGPATFRRPEGIAVSTSGECVFVSDRIKDRIVKFDGEGRIVLAFGTQGNVSGKRTIPVETVFRRPIGLHLDAAGTLWVSDRNNEVIQRFGLPGALTAGGPAGGSFRVTDEEESREQNSRASSELEEFYLRQAYAIPNPCKGCGSQGFVVQVGLADSVSLECRNMMGRVVYQNAFGASILKDTGNGRGPQYTYETHWPLSGVGTGVYACVVTARKAGKPEIKKIIRAAIIK